MGINSILGTDMTKHAAIIKDLESNDFDLKGVRSKFSRLEGPKALQLDIVLLHCGSRAPSDALGHPQKDVSAHSPGILHAVPRGGKARPPDIAFHGKGSRVLDWARSCASRF